MEQSLVLIDEENLRIRAKKRGVKLDYLKMIEGLNYRRIFKIVIYHPLFGGEKETGYIRKLKKLGIEVRTKPVKRFKNAKAKANFDVELTIDAMSLADKVDVVCISSMDGDFEPLVTFLKSRGKRVEAIAFKNHVSRDLLRSVDRFVPITENMFLKKKDRPCLKVSIKDHLLETGQYCEGLIGA